MGLTPTPPVATPSNETLLEFPDNRLLIDLCGANDRHLARIEEALGVHILRRGNQLAVVGTPEAQAEAALLLRGLYARLEQGRPVSLAEVEAAANRRLAQEVRDTSGRIPAAAIDQPFIADRFVALDQAPEEAAELGVLVDDRIEVPARPTITSLRTIAWIP